MKNQWLDKIKSGKVAVIESHYAPKNNTNCIWLKDGVMYVYGNAGWESLGTGGGGVDNLLIKPTYPVEVPWHHTNVDQVVYLDINEPTEVPYTYMPDETVYIIGKKNDAYTLIGTLPTEGIGVDFWRNVSATIWIYGQEIKYNSAQFESDIIDTNENIIGRIKVGVTYDIFEEGEEPTWAWVSHIVTYGIQAYDSLIFDTEYNTDKYPDGVDTE